MKAVLNIVAAVLIAAGFVVAVASLLTPGQVILGIDFKLAATLVIGGLIVLALARALALLERMSHDLRQLRKAGSEAPPWLREAAGQSGIQAAAAMAMAEGAAPAETASHGPGGEPAQEVGQDIGWDSRENIAEQPAAEAEWPRTNETEWPEVSEVQWPEAPEPAPGSPTSPEAEPAEPVREEEAELPFLNAPAPSEPAEYDRERGFEPEPEPEPESEEQVVAPFVSDSEPEPAEAAPEDYTELPGEPAPPDAAPEDDATEPSEHQFVEPEDSAGEDEADVPRRLKPSQYAPWSPDDPAEAADEPGTPQQEQWPEEAAPEDQSSQEQAPEEQSLYVVEERMFRGKQARVLSDGTVEAETAEGWMRFEDFDHLEEYLDAMAELGR